nr:hypothetical protein [Tanacetum cinerariifolium]
MVDRYTKNALWDYWRRGDDEEVITDNGLSNLGDDNLIKEYEIDKIFRIDTIYFALRHLYVKHSGNSTIFLKSIHEVMMEYGLNLSIIFHECNPLRLKNETTKWSTYNWKEGGYCNTGDLPGFIQEGSLIRCENYEWENQVTTLGAIVRPLTNGRIMSILLTLIDAYSNQNTYNNVCQIVMDLNETYENHGWFDKYELMGNEDDDINGLEDYLIQKDPPYYVIEEEERFKE